MLYCCTIPNDEFEICCEYFGFLKLETIKLIFGKLYVLLADNFKGNKNKYNTTSFKILIEKVVNKLPDEETANLSVILDRINDIDQQYKEFRNQMYAHIDLSKNNFLKRIEDFNLSSKNITDLVNLAEEAYDALFKLLEDASSDHMKNYIDSLSCKLWKSYEEAGLVKRL